MGVLASVIYFIISFLFLFNLCQNSIGSYDEDKDKSQTREIQYRDNKETIASLFI